MPAFFTHLSDTDKDILALYKEQMCRYLIQTLLKKYNVDFGISHDPKTRATESEIAIPYDGVDHPNEKSRFSNTITAMNFPG